MDVDEHAYGPGTLKGVPASMGLRDHGACRKNTGSKAGVQEQDEEAGKALEQRSLSTR